MTMKNQAAQLQRAPREWQGLYRAAAGSAIGMAAITLAQFVVFAVASPPVDGTAQDWFAVFQQSAWRGLLGFEGLLVVYALLSVVVSLGLGAALMPASRSLAALFVALSVIGGMAFVVARPALEMLWLSNQYAAATEVQKASLLAAGEAMVAMFHGTAFQVSYVLGSLSGLLIAAAMLRSGLFSRTTAYLRIGSSVFDFGLFLPGIGLYISLVSVVLLLAFNILVARRFFQLSPVLPALASPARA